MKKLFWFVPLAMISLLFATSYHILNFDGSNEFATDETFETSTLGYQQYIT